MTKFNSVRVEGWRQFGHVELKLHPRLTVLTGANGAGKSSLLKLFTRHFGFDRPFLSTPVRTPSGGYSYVTGLFSGTIAKFWQRWWTRRPDETDMSNVGTILYANGVEAVLQVPRESGVQYNVNISNQQSIAGIHIDSHSPISSFQQVGQIPTTIIRADAAYHNYNSEIQSRYQGGNSGYSPTYRMKEAIIAMAMFGEGNTHVQGNADVLNAYKGYVEALRKMLPESLGFMDLSVRPPEVVLVTKSGEFLIDAASGGVMTILDITWRLHMFSLMNEEFVVTIDEPENHLHPTMQRSLMRRLLSAFPSAQFIIATHSPFMVSSVRDSSVYVLRYRSMDTGELEDGEQVMPSESSRVISQKLDTINKAGSASEILREVLGVPATIPEWVEEGLADVVLRYRERVLSPEVLQDLRRDLSTLGYDELYPDALAALAERP